MRATRAYLKGSTLAKEKKPSKMLSCQVVIDSMTHLRSNGMVEDLKLIKLDLDSKLGSLP